MVKSVFGRLLAAMLLLGATTTAQAGGYYGGGGSGAAISPTNCAAGQAANGISAAGAVTGCFAALPQDQFLTPYDRNGVLTGQTTFIYNLPSTTTGRLHFVGVGNGSPGGSGGVNNSVIRTGGGGGGPGGKRVWDIAIADLVALYPGTTSLTVIFGTLGTPGPAQSTASADGTAGSASSVLYVRTNSSGTPIYASIGNGGAGGKGSAAGVAAPAGLAGGPGQPTGVASIAAGTSPLGATDALLGPTGGGAGGGVTAANAEYAGGTSGNTLENVYSTKFASGGPVEANGSSANAPYYGTECIGGIGGAGGGGSNSTSVPGGNGAAGSGYGAAGAGGGAGTNGSSSGAGGAATYGCLKITYFPY